VTILPDPKLITVGIDVSKATLDVAIGVKATPLSVSNKTDVNRPRLAACFSPVRSDSRQPCLSSSHPARRLTPSPINA
jgi:hypothetical protein